MRAKPSMLLAFESNPSKMAGSNPADGIPPSVVFASVNPIRMRFEAYQRNKL